MSLTPPFDQIPTWLIDMDGVIYRGDQLLPRADDFIRALQASGQKFLFVTNNATKTPQQTQARLRKMGIEVALDDIFTAALAAADYLTEHFPTPKRVLVLGGTGLQEAVRLAGYTVVTDADEAELVVNGLDMNITYDKLSETSLAINRGIPWVATNPDKSWPGERGQVPGAGAITALLVATTGREPIMLGKPNALMYEQALARLGVPAQGAVMLGDRLETDILGGYNAKLKTICVLTGVSTETMARTYSPPPDWIIPDLSSLLPTN